jgi:hypothetical protein
LYELWGKDQMLNDGMSAAVPVYDGQMTYPFSSSSHRSDIPPHVYGIGGQPARLRLEGNYGLIRHGDLVTLLFAFTLPVQYLPMCL